MPASITPQKQRQVRAAVISGLTIRAAAQKVGVSERWARDFVKKDPYLRNSSGREYRMRAELEAGKVYAGAKPREMLSAEALRALDDFGYFRHRYFGRRSTPWQEEAAERIVGFMATPRKEYVVINAPPGSGKSTAFVLDIPAWLTCRNRGIRGLIGSASQSLAERYLKRLREALETPFAFLAESEEKEMGLAFDAEATLIGDFGLFKPLNGLWTQQAFVVDQGADRPTTGEKEPTWTAVGLEAKYIGGRYDICLWDDAEDDRMLRSLETIDGHRADWDKVAEKRLEPGGLLVQQGQRLNPEDLSRYCLDKKAGSSQEISHDECCSAEPGKKYHHIVYRAHWDDRCVEDHGPDARYYPEGCLLDPHRLPYHELEAEMENGLSSFLQVYQQEDADPAETLVSPLWISGGTDPRTGVHSPGCWDNERGLGELPASVSPDEVVSVLSTDPSPTRFWGFQWWCWHPVSDTWILMDLIRRKMTYGDLLDWNDPSREWTGLVEEWFQRSIPVARISAWVLERNGAQRFIYQTNAFDRWQSAREVEVIAHETTAANKSDKTMGPHILQNLYRYGKVRLPGKGDDARITSLKLIEEVTKWPKGRLDDQVMAQWFPVFQKDNLPEPPANRGGGDMRTWVPSWAGGTARLEQALLAGAR